MTAAMADDCDFDLFLDQAHSARMHDYCSGGLTHFPVDREVCGKVAAVFPLVYRAALEHRDFTHRAVRYLARRGQRQFLEIGVGIPHAPNLHDTVQHIAPDARVLYADNDPIVLAHAYALFDDDSQVASMYADLTDPDAILDSAFLRDCLDLDRPVALSLTGVLHYVLEDQDARRIVQTLSAALVPGSALTITHPTADYDGAALRAAAEVSRAAGIPVRLRDRDQVSMFFDGWDLVEPGVSPAHRWRPDTLGTPDDAASCHAGVALKIDHSHRRRRPSRLVAAPAPSHSCHTEQDILVDHGDELPSGKTGANQAEERLTSAFDRHGLTRHPFGGLKVSVNAPPGEEPHLFLSGAISLAAAELFADSLDLRQPAD